MVDPHATADVAHALIPAPPSQSHLGKARQEVVLRHIGADRYRWFHVDGAQTVVEGHSIEHAMRVATLVWGGVEILSRAPD